MDSTPKPHSWTPPKAGGGRREAARRAHRPYPSRGPYSTSAADGGGGSGSRVAHVSLDAGGSAISVTDGTGSVQVRIEVVRKEGSHDRIERTRTETHTFRRGGPPLRSWAPG